MRILLGISILFLLATPTASAFQADPCPTPTDQGVGIVERLMYDEKFASYRAEADINHASVSDIRVLGAEPGDADTCDALNAQYTKFLDDPQEQMFFHACSRGGTYPIEECRRSWL